MILLGETGLLADLHQLNAGRPTGTFDLFFEEHSEIIESVSAADERRHNVAHMSQCISLRDLISRAKDKCPAGTPIPSKALCLSPVHSEKPICSHSHVFHWTICCSI